MPEPQPSPFTQALFDFFRELRSNNRRDWFEENRARYEEDVLEPSRVFVLAFRSHLDIEPIPLDGPLPRADQSSGRRRGFQTTSQRCPSGS